MKILSDKKIKNRNENKSLYMIALFARPLFIFVFSYLVCCVASLIFDFKLNNYSVISLLTFILAGLISGWIAGRKVRKNGLINGIIYTLPAIVIFCILSLIVNKSDIDYFFAVSFISQILSAGIGGVLSVNIKRKARIKK